MSEEEKYDELIRQKFAEKEFIFNEANWEKAEAMIDSSRKAKKVFWWSAVFLIGLITGIFLMFPLIKNNSAQKTNEQTKLNDPLIEADSQSAGILPDKMIGKEKLTFGNEHLLTHESFSGTDPETTSKDNKDQKNTRSAVPAEEGDSKDARQPVKMSATLNAERKNKERKNNPESGLDHLQRAEADTQLLVTKKGKKENKTKERDADDYALASEKTIMARVEKKSNRAKKEVKEEEAKGEAEKEKAAKKELVKKDELLTPATDSTHIENKSPEEIAARIDALNDSTKQAEKLATADSVQKSDSAVVVAADKSLTPALDGLASATYFSIDAGINGQLGWKNNEVAEARGITPVLGFGITHAFNQTWSATASLHYNGIGYLKGDSKTSTSTKYDFGSATTVTTAKPRFLHYLSIPLMIQYHFNDKNAILAGGSFSYLLNAKSKVQESITYVRPVDSISALQNSSSDYYTKTFNSFDAAIGLGYRRKISSRFSIAGIVNFGLLDIKQNSFFLKNTVERNSGLKIILSYNLFDF